ncbi:hypothetical protein BG004_007502 [Podila humilis]|nr:hypothetical protein BG004_007502 [Podila humilis]
MSSFMTMHYDSDSDSADDLDFQPGNDISSSSSNSAGEDTTSEQEDENMEEVVPENEGIASVMEEDAPFLEASLSTGLPVTPSTVSAPAKPSKKTTSKKKKTTTATSKSAGNDIDTKPKRGRKSKLATDSTLPLKTAKSKTIKKSSNQAPKPTPPSALCLSFVQSPFAAQNVQIDMDHPLETFKWSYSPFTSEFKEQHRARGKMVHDLHLAAQELKGTNTHASQRLQELDNRLQSSRHDLNTCLNEIQFRKSQLRDMGLMAVDIVKKLSRQASSPSSSLSAHAKSGVAATDAELVLSSPSLSNEVSPEEDGQSTAMSHAGHHMMDVDQESSGDDQSGSTYLKGLHEGNVRSFLEKIRELEQAQRRVVA